MPSSFKKVSKYSASLLYVEILAPVALSHTGVVMMGDFSVGPESFHPLVREIYVASSQV